MESQKVRIFHLYGLLLSGVVFLVLSAFSHVQAGAPQVEANCTDPDGRRIMTIYDSSLQVFAEARMMPTHEAREAAAKGLSPFVIIINPERYYLGRYTQMWLYQRQCAHIQALHPVVRDGSRSFNIDQEMQVDCQAIQSMQRDGRTSISYPQVESIERDIQRLMRENRWGEVFAGPKRRISLRDCMLK